MSDRTNNRQGDEVVLAALAEEVSTLKDFVRQQSRRDELQQKAFDQLYDELKQYKEDFVYQAEKPLLLDLLLFYDSLNWFQESLLKQEMSEDVVADSFQYLIDEFLELLYRRDVLPMEGGDRYDRERHKAIKVEPTDDRSRDWTVANVVKRGFTRAEKVLRPEEVVIRRFRTEGEDGSGGGQR